MPYIFHYKNKVTLLRKLTNIVKEISYYTFLYKNEMIYMNGKIEPRPKILPPSMRTRGRYLVFEIVSEAPVEYNEFRDSFWNSAVNFLGELGTSEAHPIILKNLYDPKSQRGVIKCGHDMVEQARTSLALISMIGESRAVVRIDGVTGTIKSARNKYLGMRDLRSFR